MLTNTLFAIAPGQTVLVQDRDGSVIHTNTANEWRYMGNDRDMMDLFDAAFGGK